MMFDHMIEVNNLWSEFMRHGLEENDIVFIKEQIAGPLESEMCSQQTNVSGKKGGIRELWEVGRGWYRYGRNGRVETGCACKNSWLLDGAVCLLS